MIQRHELADPPPHRHTHQMGALQAEGVEQAQGVLCQVAQGVGCGTRLVADRSAGVAVVVADDEPGAGHETLAEAVLPPVHRGCPSHDEDGGSALSPKVWTQRSTPFARMILSLGSIGRISGPGVGGCSGAWPFSMLVMRGRSSMVAASSSWSIRQYTLDPPSIRVLYHESVPTRLSGPLP